MFLSYSRADQLLGSDNVRQEGKSFIFRSPCDNQVDCTPYLVKLLPGKYTIEAWGSSGGAHSTAKNWGLGGYSKGEIFFHNKTSLYLYIGTKTSFNSSPFHDGYTALGGGASDVRLVGGKWDDFDSLKSRILVAGGGGGVEWDCSVAGNGGSLVGGTGYGTKTPGQNVPLDHDCFAEGGSQTSSGEAAQNYPFHSVALHNGVSGGFGFSGYNLSTKDFGGCGGGGFYGGASMDYAGAGGGGSSFISGHEGCDAIHENSTNTSIIHTHQSVHFSLFLFRKTEMISGNSTMPLFSHAAANAVGNKETGAVRITLMPSVFSCHKQMSFPKFLLLFTFLWFSH